MTQTGDRSPQDARRERQPGKTGEAAGGSWIGLNELRVTPAAAGRYSLSHPTNSQPTGDSSDAEIGRGAIGRVLLAFDEHLGREVALKELLSDRVGVELDKFRFRPDEAAGSSDQPVTVDKVSAVVARFLREARVTGQLEHPNIVPVYELGRNRNNTLYYTMKMVRGRTLAEAIEQAKGLAGRLKLLNHFVDLCQAIAYAHSRGVVHRDLKPENVMLGEFGETVVLDWGLAKVRGTQDIREQEIEREVQLLREIAGGGTVDGTALGTPAFMSPEQARGHIDEIDERSDVWSLGAVLYQILSGHPPYEGNTAFEILRNALREPVRPILQVCPWAPAELASVCEKALCPEKARRYQSARELSEETNAYLTGGRVKAYDYRFGDLMRRFAQRHRLAFAVGGVSLLLLILLGIWSYLRLIADRDHARALQTAADAARQTARTRWAEAHWEGARTALMRRDMLEARAKLRSSLEVTDSVPGRVLWNKATEESLVWKRVLGGLVYDVAFSPRGDAIAAAGHDGSITLLDLHTAEVRLLRGHRPWVATLDFSPDGARLASAGADGTIRIWNLDAGRVSRLLTGHRAAIHDVAFSADGQWLASCSQDRSVRLWQTSTGALLRTIDSPGVITWCLRFSPNADQLVTGSRDGFVRFFDVQTGDELARIRAAGGGVAALAVSPDGRRLATGGSKALVQVWDLAAHPSQSKPIKTLRGHRDGIAELAISPDGGLLASGSYDRTVRLWKLNDGGSSAAITEHREYVGGVAFSPNGHCLATASEDRSVALWRLPLVEAAPRPSKGHTDMVNTVALSPDGRWLASGGDDRTVRVWELQSGEELAVLTGHADAVRGSRFAEDGSLMSSGLDKRLFRWRLEPVSTPPGPQITALQGDADLLTGLVVSPDGRWAASADYDRSIRVWDLTTGEERRLVGHTDLIRGLDFSPDSRRLASASWDHTVRVWNPARGEQLCLLTGHRAEVDNVVFSPDGAFVLSASWDQTLRRSDLATGNSSLLCRYDGRVVTLAIDSKGKRFATGDEDGLVKVWNLETTEQVTLRGHRNEVTDLHFSPDGRFLASSSDDCTVRLWDVTRSQPVWRAPVMIASANEPPRVFTHRGWIVPGTSHPRDDPSSRAWLQAAKRARSASLSADGVGDATACIHTADDSFEMWDRVADRRLFHRRMAGIEQLQAFAGGCAIRADGEVVMFSTDGEPIVQVRSATAMGWALGQLLVAADGEVKLFETSGLERLSLQADVGVTALTRIRGQDGDRIALGYQDGTVELLPGSGGSRRSNPSLEQVPSSPVAHMLPGPRGTLILGYANGLLGLWDLKSGARLDHVKLHGPLAHAAFHQGTLYVATELGDHLAWDLSIFSADYCHLLQAVWRTVPVVWEGGRPVRRQPPSDHPCAARQPVSDRQARLGRSSLK